VAQGQLANDLVLECPHLPVAIDLYDPWLVENLSYVATLGFDPWRNDHATWVLQMSRGDFFLCSSEEQRNYYLGFLTALGRVNPERIADDPDLTTLIAPVPFGVPDELPSLRRALRLVRPMDSPRGPGAAGAAVVDSPAHPQSESGQHAAAPPREGGGALPQAGLVGEPRPLHRLGAGRPAL
jgi:hypothetical protein